MNKLPYFLVLVKQNILLYTIISSGSFSQIDLKNQNIEVWSESVIEFKNFKLSKNEEFKSVRIMISNFGLHIDLKSESSKYFENTEKYFGKDIRTRKKEYEMFEEEVRSDSKRLGKFEDFKPTIDVTLYNSSLYGQNISLFIDKKEYVTTKN